VCEVAEDVEAVVRELERLQREQARIRAVLEKYQKIEEERKALLKRVEGEINEAKGKAKKIGMNIEGVLKAIETVITTDDKLMLPAGMDENAYRALASIAEKVDFDDGPAKEFIIRLAAYCNRELAKRQIVSEMQKIREGGVINFPPADVKFKVFNELTSVILEKGEKTTADDVENAVKKVTRRATAAAGASRARRGGGRRTRKTGVANYIWEELQKRGEISLEEGAELLVDAGFYDDLNSAKNGFNSAQYTICRWTDPQTGAPLAEYENGVLRLL